MKRICTWCMKNLGDVYTKYHEESFTTHAICKDCAGTLFAELKMGQLEIFLEKLPEPVVVVDRDGIVLTANNKARDLLGKSLSGMMGFMLGDIIECRHAGKPGGCGKTVHCNGCAIRMSVEETYNTGKSNINVPTYTETVVEGKTPIFNLLTISTARVSGVVVLRIDTLGERKSANPGEA